MIDGEWRLVYPGVDYSFGAWGFPVFNATTPELGEVEFTVGDGSRPYQDGVNFGVDSRSGRTVSFDLTVSDLKSELLVRGYVRRFLQHWRADPIRTTPGALAELHTQYAGIHRVMYGRPRRADPIYANTAATLTASIQATFVTTDDVFYDPFTVGADVTLIGNDQGGLIAPLAAPLATTGTSDRSVFTVLSTEIPAWPRITISGGQVTNPVVEVLGQWRIGLRTSLAYDDVVVIDTRPWKRTILKNGFSIAGTLDANSTRLARCGTRGGSLEVAFNGQSMSNTATARIEWNGAYSTHS